MTDKKLLEIYMQGFSDELSGMTYRIYEYVSNELSQRAYILGTADAMIGDDSKSSDLQTDQEILEKIYNYE